MDLDELERKKRELELRSEIGRLERNERVADSLAKFDFGLLWVLPVSFCIAFGLFGLAYVSIPLPTMTEGNAALVYLALTPIVFFCIQRIRRKKK
jgi:hypothetical protein